MTIVVLCLPRLSRPEIYWFHVLSAGIVRSSNRKGIRSAMSIQITLVSLQVRLRRLSNWDRCWSPVHKSLFRRGTAVAERANQTLTTIVRCLKLAGKIPDRAVSELYDTAEHLHNRLPHRRTGNEKTQNLSYLRAIGCTAYVHQPGQIRPKKHSPHDRKGTLIGCNSSQNSKYRILMDYKTC